MAGINTLKTLNRFRKNIENWKSAIIAVYLKKFSPFEVHFKDGTKMPVKYLTTYGWLHMALNLNMATMNQ